MNYYHYNNIDDRPMLGPVENDPQETASNDSQDCDLDYIKEVNQLLDEISEEFTLKPSTISTEKCDFSEDINNHADPIPCWYKEKLQSKIKETESRLEMLSNLVCYTCDSAKAHIKRIEQDHGAIFCKMDYPRYPPLNKPWTNSWKFNCTIKCKEMGKSNHAHTTDCEKVVLEHVDTGVSIATSNICHNEYPNFVMDVVELFQEFATETIRNGPFSDLKKAPDIAYEKTMWTGIKLVVRSNYKNELMIVVRGKGINSLKSKLRRYFEFGPGYNSNVISVSCIDQKWSRKKGICEPEKVTGLYKLKDKVGPVSIEYKPKISVDFNSVEAIQLGKIIDDYAGLTKETTLLDIGCNFGILSLMMSRKCEMVIGLNTMHSVNSDICQAEELKKLNESENVSFIGCDPEDLLTKCSPFIKRCISVAVLNLSSPYGKSKHVVQALRDMPSIWRVIIYGAFTKEFRANIVTLTTENDEMGERYLPMQGCILDKSPLVDNAFDIVILFERKSLILPKIELLASGPTLNIKHDFETNSCPTLDEKVKPKLKIDRNLKSEYSEERIEKKSSWFVFPSISKDLEVRALPKEEKLPQTIGNRSLSAKRKSFDCSVLRKADECLENEKLYQQFSDKKPFLSYPSLSIKEEFQFDSSPPREKFPNLPPSLPPTDDLVDKTQIKKEKDDDDSAFTTIKSEPLQFYEYKESSISNLKDDGIPIKSEIADPNYITNCENVPLPVTIKSEPVDSRPTSVKNEPEDMEISPIVRDVENMQTPIHNPKALNNNNRNSAHLISTSITTSDGFEFTVQANMSYLALKRDSDQAYETVNVKMEPEGNKHPETDDEIKVIGEQKREQRKDSKSRIRVRTVDEVIKVKSELKEDDDLDTLYEQRKKILEKLNQEKETPDLPRRYEQQSSPRHRSSRKRNRSPSPRRFIRSPSPRKYYNRSSSPHKHRSPSSKRRRRSPQRSRRSPSPNRRHRRRPSTSPVRFKREPYSPDRFRRDIYGRTNDKSPDRSRDTIDVKPNTDRSLLTRNKFK